MAVVLDLKSRKVIGWSMKDNLGQTLVHEALEMAVGRRLSTEAPKRCSFTVTAAANTRRMTINSDCKNGASCAV